MFGKKNKYLFLVNRFTLFFFISGILIGLMVYFYTEANYEDKVFNQLSKDLDKQILDKGITTDSGKILTTIHFAHNFIEPRQKLFSETEIGGFKSGIIQPLIVDLMTGHGSCGSYTLVTARLLQEMNIPFRIVQMKVNGTFGGHILLEAKYANEKWAVLDPSYNLYFINKQGELADFDEVHDNWDKYSKELPEGYNMSYNYEDKRYTNWNKIPFIMPAAKKVFEWIWGKENVEHFSLRAHTLSKFKIYFNGLFLLQVIIFIYMLYYTFLSKRFSIRLNHFENVYIASIFDKKINKSNVIPKKPQASQPDRNNKPEFKKTSNGY